MGLSDLIEANRKSLFKLSILYFLGVGLAFLPVNLFPTNDWAIVFSLFMTLAIAPTNDFFGNIVDSFLSISTSYFVVVTICLVLRRFNRSIRIISLVLLAYFLIVFIFNVVRVEWGAF